MCEINVLCSKTCLLETILSGNNSPADNSSIELVNCPSGVKAIHEAKEAVASETTRAVQELVVLRKGADKTCNRKQRQ